MALIGNTRGETAEAIRTLRDMRLMVDEPDLLIAVEAGTRAFRVAHGAIVGDLFARGSTEPIGGMDAAREEAFEASQGRLLVEVNWGNYVAIWRSSADRVYALRAPLGRVPALYRAIKGGWLIASDLRLIEAAAGRRREIDWLALGSLMAQPEMKQGSTCLVGLCELGGGCRLALGARDVQVDTVWTPWDALESCPLTELNEAAARLRDIVRYSVAACARQHSKSVLLLSGGLDSAIVAACLAHDDHDFTCLNLRMEGRGGDEADYARRVAEKLGRPLRVEAPRLEDVDLTRTMAPDAPYPTRHGFEQAVEARARACAQDIGATAVLTGGGGDNVFYSLLSVAPAADRLASVGPDQRYRALIAALADLSGLGWLEVAWKSILYARRGQAKSGPPASLAFLSAAARDRYLVDQHPWRRPPSSLGMGKASMVAALAPAQWLAESRDPIGDLPEHTPLVSQPIFDLCLRVAGDLWFAPGRNRALARTAFETELPAETIARRSKGTPAGFLARLFDQRRGQIREFLFEGLMQSEGLLDLPAIGAVLDNRCAVTGTSYLRVMEFVDAEAWARAQR